MERLEGIVNADIGTKIGTVDPLLCEMRENHNGCLLQGQPSPNKKRSYSFGDLE